MTQKELLYLEDAVTHEDSIISICSESINNLDDEELVNFFNEQKENHVQIKNNLMNLLEGKSNG